MENVADRQLGSRGNIELLFIIAPADSTGEGLQISTSMISRWLMRKKSTTPIVSNVSIL